MDFREPGSMNYARSLETVNASVFAKYVHRLRLGDEDFYPLHIGDMFFPPDASWRLDGHSQDTEDCYAYDATQGWPVFREALADKIRRKNKIDIQADQVFPTFGATQGVDMLMSLLLDPGDEVLVLSPYWPLIRGMLEVGSFGYTEVPYSDLLRRGQTEQAWELLEQAVQSETRAIYLINPNNPNGYVYKKEELEYLLAFAQRHDLWIIADEAYEDFVYQGTHISLASLPEASERTFTVYTMSKSFCVPGYRLGYVVGPAKGIQLMNRIGRGRTYCHSRFLTKLGVTALAHESPFRERLTDFMRRNRALLGDAFPGVDPPAGGAYYFVPFASEQGAISFLEEALDAGVSVAPGRHFGSDYGAWNRICFSSESAERLSIATERLKPIYARWSDFQGAVTK